MQSYTPPLSTEAPLLLTIPAASRLLGGPCRSTIYNLIELGELKSVSLRARGQVRGRRMILRESVEDYVKRLAGDAA